MLVILYMALGYWAYGYVNRNKIYIYSGHGNLFMHKLIYGTLFGWFLIPLAILKMLFGK